MDIVIRDAVIMAKQDATDSFDKGLRRLDALISEARMGSNKNHMTHNALIVLHELTGIAAKLDLLQRFSLTLDAEEGLPL